MFTAKFDFILTCISEPQQPPPQALRFSHCRGERLVMNRKGPWEGYRRLSFPPSFARTFSSRERRLGTRQGPQCKLVGYTSNCAAPPPPPHPFTSFSLEGGIINLFHFEPSIQADNGLFFSWDGKYGNFENEDFISVWKGTKVKFFHLRPTLTEAQEVCPTVVGFAGLGRGGLSINL